MDLQLAGVESIEKPLLLKKRPLLLKTVVFWDVLTCIPVEI
jgi:hypothetical protein